MRRAGPCVHACIHAAPGVCVLGMRVLAGHACPGWACVSWLGMRVLAGCVCPGWACVSWLGVCVLGMCRGHACPHLYRQQ